MANVLVPFFCFPLIILWSVCIAHIITRELERDEDPGRVILVTVVLLFGSMMKVTLFALLLRKSIGP